MVVTPALIFLGIHITQIQVKTNGFKHGQVQAFHFQMLVKAVKPSFVLMISNVQQAVKSAVSLLVSEPLH